MRIVRIAKRISDEYLVLRGFVKSILSANQNNTMTEPVDIVVTWVDGNDPVWQAEKQAYSNKEGNVVTQGNGLCRYRDWSFFRYWFRAIEQYAPWVNKVYFVTQGHIPTWLNIDSPKLKIVRHTDFIPAEYLPTFNSNPIELNLHRIPGLSEHFVYFNDDVFLARPCKVTDFFENGKPKCCPVPIPFIPHANQMAYHIFFGTYCEVNQKNDFSTSIRLHPELWFSYLNFRHLHYVRDVLKNSYILGGFFSHMGVPMCKSTMEQAWKKYPSIQETCTHRFRTYTDMTHLLFTVENLISGNFAPVKVSHFGEIIDMKNFEGISHLFFSQERRMVCFTDSNAYTDEDEICINRTLNEMFEKVFPQKSIFER